VLVLKTQTVCVNPLYCRNKLASLSSTFMPNIKLNMLFGSMSTDKLLFVLFHTKTTINGYGQSLKVANIN